MIEGRRLLIKLLEDWGGALIGFGILVAAYYGFRYIDPGATTDGIANVYLAIQVFIVGYLCASLAAFICARLFGNMGRRESIDLAKQSWLGFIVASGQKVVWLIVFYLLFSRSIGQ